MIRIMELKRMEHCSTAAVHKDGCALIPMLWPGMNWESTSKGDA